MDSRELRNALGRFATGVTVVTCRGEDRPHGLTVNSFTSVSLDPPLVLVSIDRRANAVPYLTGRPFAVNILAAGQEDLAWHFAGRAQPDLEVAWVEGRLCPRLAHSLAYFECSPWRAYDGGDHVLFLGRVEEFAYGQGEPLVFYASRMTRLVPPGPQPER
ncbi:MAG: flavin reductase family protein [Thermaerobacter sp.]|nr:flavin reductase [Bacillota bacterium]